MNREQTHRELRIPARSTIIDARALFGKPISDCDFAIVHYDRGNAYRRKGDRRLPNAFKPYG